MIEAALNAVLRCLTASLIFECILIKMRPERRYQHRVPSGL
jgi:hypothetical protein